MAPLPTFLPQHEHKHKDTRCPARPFGHHPVQILAQKGPLLARGIQQGLGVRLPDPASAIHVALNHREPQRGCVHPVQIHLVGHVTDQKTLDVTVDEYPSLIADIACHSIGGVCLHEIAVGV